MPLEMLTLRRGRVTAVVERVEGLSRLEVDGEPCIAYPRLTGPVALGDDVIVNTQARELALGSGGFDVLYANLTRGLDLFPENDAHVMKLPYTPAQNARRHGEEGRTLPETLAGLPVVCCSLHSQVVPVCAGIGEGTRVAYVQLAGGALPVSFSDALRALRERGLVEMSIAVGACLDGDIECVSAASALLLAAAEGFDVVACAIGPGILGTGSTFGHGGLAAADAANAAAALQGAPILAVRASEGDSRERHHGVSHHTRAVLDLCLGEVIVPWPAGYEAPSWLELRVDVDVSGWEEACAGLPLAHMGRGPQDDPHFFAAAFAAGRIAGDRIR
jgi:uncharacterized protein DUF3866